MKYFLFQKLCHLGFFFWIYDLLLKIKQKKKNIILRSTFYGTVVNIFLSSFLQAKPSFYFASVSADSFLTPHGETGDEVILRVDMINIFYKTCLFMIRLQPQT